jgi:hypothetical protein
MEEVFMIMTPCSNDDCTVTILAGMMRPDGDGGHHCPDCYEQPSEPELDEYKII